ncbi:hypothetical protein BGZ60DRAFT_464896 [Tricladium varicosporioides]|nr:hypothetical protein BGZ60DRAFT_464896 [Hymenoscyphus varicosporioides]
MVTTMKAWQYKAIHGKLENSLEFSTVTHAPSTTTLTKGQILIETISASLNPIDYKIPELGFVSKLIISTPATPGLDFCGRVVGTYASNDTFKIGDIVYGALSRPTKFGSLGEFMIAPSGECALLPEGLDPDHAAAIGTAGQTAFQSLDPRIVKKGSKVFINGGSGGTGTFGIQFAKILGAEVTTTCSTKNVELCKSLGADEVIDYTQVDILSELKKRGQVFDLAIDNVGRPALLYERSGEFLKPGAKFVEVGVQVSLSGFTKTMGRKVIPRCLGGGNRPFHFLVVQSKQEDLTQIGKWLVDGKARVVIDEIFKREDVPKAFERLRTGRTVGKIVVQVGEK